MTELAESELRPRSQRPDVVWWLILGVAAADAALFLIGALTRPWGVVWSSQAVVAAGVLLLGVIWWVYGSIRPAPRLAGAARTGALFILYTNVIGTFSYLLAGTLRLPLLDRQLAAIDHALGFDWVAFHQWVSSAPWLWLAANVLYGCLGPQLILLIMLLDLLGRTDRAREFFLGFAISSLAVVILGCLLPAAGAFVEYAVPEARVTPYVLDYMHLRDGSLHQLNPFTMQGIVQFPSFHAALAVLCCYVVRGMRWLFPLFLLMNALVIVVTPPIGGHHFIDVIVGLLLAGATLKLLSCLPPRPTD